MELVVQVALLSETDGAILNADRVEYCEREMKKDSSLNNQLKERYAVVHK